MLNILLCCWLLVDQVHCNDNLLPAAATNQEKNACNQFISQLKATVLRYMCFNNYSETLYLNASFSWPPNAVTVRIELITSSATAPALAYAASSFFVMVEIS